MHEQLDTLVVWYTLRVLLFGGGKFSDANVPFRLNSSFLIPTIDVSYIGWSVI